MSPGAHPSLVPGARFDRFELVRPVQGSALREVWLALDVDERRVALRVLRPTADARLREAVLQEARVASSFAHANVARIVAFGEADGLAWVASEWVEGEPLSDLLATLDADRREVPVAVLLRVLAGALAGLHAAHLVRDGDGRLLNVVHGDLTAGSLVLDATGSTRVVGLGFVKGCARGLGGANRSWSGEGATPVAPPTQRIDRHADVWAVGAILETALARTAASDPTPEGTGPTMPMLLRELAHRARASDPMERFATAAEMQGAIEAAMVSLGIGATTADVAAFVKGVRPPPVSAPPPVIDSLPATARSLGPVAPIVITTPLASQRALLDAGEVTTDAFAQYVVPAEAIAEARRGESQRRRAIMLLATAGASVVALGITALFATRAPARGAARAAAPEPSAAPRGCPAAMVPVPGGPFYMGSDDDLPAERPAHHVVLSPFCIDASEVTTEAYLACMEAGACPRPGTEPTGGAAGPPHVPTGRCTALEPSARAAQPINCVDWDMARMYCASRGARLPTEAEWELAARGPDGRKFPWGDAPPQSAAAVDRSPYGALGFAGGVAEWTADWYAPYDEGSAEDPRGASGGVDRVVRGRAEEAEPGGARATARAHTEPGARSASIGFRCAVDAP